MRVGLLTLHRPSLLDVAMATIAAAAEAALLARWLRRHFVIE